jgi:hypothetical protein
MLVQLIKRYTRRSYAPNYTALAPAAGIGLTPPKLVKYPPYRQQGQ